MPGLYEEMPEIKHEKPASALPVSLSSWNSFPQQEPRTEELMGMGLTCSFLSERPARGTIEWGGTGRTLAFQGNVPPRGVLDFLRPLMCFWFPSLSSGKETYAVFALRH